MSNLFVDYIVNNSANVTLADNCVSFKNSVIFEKEDIVTKMNLVTSYVILVLGVVGNTLAIIAHKFSSFGVKGGKHPSSTSLYINKFIIKWFLIFSLLTVLMQIESPIMKIHGDSVCCQTFWNSKTWKVYLGHLHYPITKTLMTFSFFLYFIFFGVQIVAVKYPTHFKGLVTKPRVVVIMIMFFVYCAIWYVPTFKWFYIVRIPVCQHGSNMKWSLEGSPNLSVFVYTYKYYVPLTKKTQYIWGAYQTLRELCVNIIPFFALITIKWVVASKRRLSQPTFQAINHVTPSGLESGMNYIKEISGGVTRSNTEIRTTIEQTNFELELSNLRKKRLREKEQHSKTLIILTIEFVIFLLPISIMEMIIDHLILHYNRRSISKWYVFLSTLQYMYYSLTFYINLSFNSIYRERVFQSFKKL
ncbi:unnamed protein product [Gordionus sp. m RMFG-2023]